MNICRINAECIKIILNSQWVHTRMHGSIYSHKKDTICVKFAIFLQNSDYNFNVTWDITKIIHIAFEALYISA